MTKTPDDHGGPATPESPGPGPDGSRDPQGQAPQGGIAVSDPADGQAEDPGVGDLIDAEDHDPRGRAATAHTPDFSGVPGEGRREDDPDWAPAEKGGGPGGGASF